MSDIDVKTKVKRVENSTTKKQEEDLKSAQARIQEKNKQILEKRQSNKQVQEEKKIESEASNSFNTKEVTALASKLLGSKKQGGFFKGLLIGVIIGLLLGSLVVPNVFGSLGNKIEETKENADKILDETFLGYTAADFKNAILGKSIEKQDLIVMEQPLTIDTTITKAGLGNLEIFSKVKTIHFAGKGVYTVDLSKINEDNIEVDEQNKNVIIYIPHTVLHDVVADFENTTFEDTEKGLLAFGDISLTAENQNELEKSVQASMKEELNSKELLNKADEIAQTKTWEIFNPLVEAVSDEYITFIKFIDEKK